MDNDGDGNGGQKQRQQEMVVDVDGGGQRRCSVVRDRTMDVDKNRDIGRQWTATETVMEGDRDGGRKKRRQWIVMDKTLDDSGQKNNGIP